MTDNIKYQNAPKNKQGKNVQKQKTTQRYKSSNESKYAIEWVHQRLNEMVRG